MPINDLIIEPLSAHHPRKSFTCGTDPLDNFIRDYALQNQKRHISRTFVAVPNAKLIGPNKTIAGYYTLVSGHVSCKDLPNDYKHPSYPVSIARVARLAVAIERQGQGIGSYLLYDAFQKILRAAETIGIYAVVVDAKNEQAKKFYQQYGFDCLQQSGLTLILSLQTIQKAIAKS